MSHLLEFIDLGFLANSPLVAMNCGDARLNELPEFFYHDGLLVVLASYMDAHDVCQLDASCNEWRMRNKTLRLWRDLGVGMWAGIDLESAGTFEQPLHDQFGGSSPSVIDWKARYRMFKKELLEFRKNEYGTEVTKVQNPDEVVYCKCKLRTDMLKMHTEANSRVSLHPSSEPGALFNGVYLEVEVNENPDNLSLVVVDFDDGERSSVTFSPDTGAVIKETKSQDAPQKVMGAYIQPLRSVTRRFVGQMGIFLHNGQIAFFRKYKMQPSDDCLESAWECTGFILDVHWTEGRKLTPCLAFRDEGSYKVRISKVDSGPPVWPKRMSGAYNEKNWIELNWEIAQTM